VNRWSAKVVEDYIIARSTPSLRDLLHDHQRPMLAERWRPAPCRMPSRLISPFIHSNPEKFEANHQNQVLLKQSCTVSMSRRNHACPRQCQRPSSSAHQRRRSRSCFRFLRPRNRRRMRLSTSCRSTANADRHLDSRPALSPPAEVHHAASTPAGRSSRSPTSAAITARNLPLR